MGFKGNQLAGIFGEIRIRRGLYRAKEGNYRFLLDEKMGLEKGNHVSSWAEEASRTGLDLLQLQGSGAKY